MNNDVSENTITLEESETKKVVQDVYYYLKIPGRSLYLSKESTLKVEFSVFPVNAKQFSDKESACNLAMRHDLEVIECTVTTTIEKQEITLKGENT